ncbi:MAG: DUF2935 domain-containing protein [Lachnospiraceae bacterium]
MENYAVFSIETHLFFSRIMKEHSLFLEAGFPCENREWIARADFFRRGFEEILEQAVRLGDGIVSGAVLDSQELVTRFTIPAEQKTSWLTGIAIDSRISEMEKNLRSGRGTGCSRTVVRMVNRMNERALGLVNGLIQFKENILKEVGRCRLFTTNYPLLIQHILREAKLYRAVLLGLRRNRKIAWKELYGKEDFWNQIMMEHALFIRGLLDPAEEKLIQTSSQFAGEYRKLLEMAEPENTDGSRQESAGCSCRQEKADSCSRQESTECGCRQEKSDSGNRENADCGCRENRESVSRERLCRKSLEETLKYREFKTAGAEGILNCSITSVILPLLADHVLREANHYIRILKMNCGQEG